MASKTYSQEVIVLTKTKLGESDLILRMLASDGSLIEAVAKGARKPSQAASATLELFNHARLLLARGRSLDVVSESRLLTAWPLLHTDPAYGAAAGTICEFMAKLAQPELAAPSLFGLTLRALRALAESEPASLCKLVATTLLKACAMAGVGPRLLDCAVCGREVYTGERARVGAGVPLQEGSAPHQEGSGAPLQGSSGEDSVWFSMTEGGVLCESCAPDAEADLLPRPTLAWAEYLIMSRFDEIEPNEADAVIGQDVLELALRWVVTQLGIRLKSATALVQYCLARPLHV